ncbi:hypothetical protein [uncultured Shewanella sp.]|uniref:hypothetical protein n=1 Tax=uncultured Shewanella sp. TaxID=173975 RepID=UPI0026036D98|nr:hypothetical protein [uncultured Shewanella sp.]
MTKYIIGGWSQDVATSAPQGFTYTMYGMITNLVGLTAGTAQSPGWSPATVEAPKVPTGKVMWTYGGGLCSPNAMPSSATDVDKIVSATTENKWAGVDFDDECQMNIPQIINTMSQLKTSDTKQSSYTFLAGWDYNNPAGNSGTEINNAVKQIAAAKCCDRFILMCYASAMWPMTDITANVGPAIERTINLGVPKKQVILALTPEGLTDENLAYFIDQVISHDIGGLFIWDYPNLPAKALSEIKDKLNID